MSFKTALQREWRPLGVGAAVMALLLIIVSLIQHRRHGWPFSLHHGRVSVPASRAPMTPPHTGDQTLAAHPRVAVELEPSRVNALGVRFEEVRLESVARPIRAVATVVPDESRVSHVHTRVAGWIEKLYVNTTGQHVRAGEPLAGIFSQELLSSQLEYLALVQSGSTSIETAALEAARARLTVLGMTDAEIRALTQRRTTRRLTTVAAPRTGVVVHRGISVGTAVEPGTELLTVADLSRVWVFAEVPEADVPNIRRGTVALLEFPASGRAPFEARVEFLYPTLTERTRTLRVRFVVDNLDGALRPGLYGSAEFRVEPRQSLTVPRDAVVDTGVAQHVFVVESEGRFTPRAVKLGARLGDRVEIRDGLTQGETIVASGVFLIDSESRLRASGGTGHVGHGTPAPPQSGQGVEAGSGKENHSNHQPVGGPSVDDHARHGN